MTRLEPHAGTTMWRCQWITHTTMSKTVFAGAWDFTEEAEADTFATLIKGPTVVYPVTAEPREPTPEEWATFRAVTAPAPKQPAPRQPEANGPAGARLGRAAPTGSFVAMLRACGRPA